MLSAVLLRHANSRFASAMYATLPATAATSQFPMTLGQVIPATTATVAKDPRDQWNNTTNMNALHLILLLPCNDKSDIATEHQVTSCLNYALRNNSRGIVVHRVAVSPVSETNPYLGIDISTTTNSNSTPSQSVRKIMNAINSIGSSNPVLIVAFQNAAHVWNAYFKDQHHFHEHTHDAAAAATATNLLSRNIQGMILIDATPSALSFLSLHSNHMVDCPILFVTTTRNDMTADQVNTARYHPRVIWIHAALGTRSRWQQHTRAVWLTRLVLFLSSWTMTSGRSSSPLSKL
jgi:hypothetical protein